MDTKHSLWHSFVCSSGFFFTVLLFRKSWPSILMHWLQVSKNANLSQSVCLWRVVASQPSEPSWHFASVSCFLPQVVSADGLTFSLPLVLTAVSAAHWLSFLNCSSLAFHCLLCLVCFSQKKKKIHLCVSSLVSNFFLVFLSKTPLKALAHMHSFPVALFHRRNRDDPRKVCLAAQCGFPPLYFVLFSGLLLFLSLFNPAFCSLSCCFSLSDQGGFLGQLL